MTQKTLDQLCDKFVRNLSFDIYGAKISKADPEIASLAQQLVEKGKQLGLQQLADSVAIPFNHTHERDFDAPPEYTHSGILDQPWSDHTTQPLEENEEWNKGRRRSNSNVDYALDENGLPVNPFFNYGIKGRGIIGRYGPNHAVDMGPCRIMNNAKGQPALHVLGIVREDSGLPALCGGFTNFERYPNGRYPYSKRILYETQASEFFEELVSGSVELLPEYTVGLEEEIEEAFKKRAEVEGKPVCTRQQNVLRNQITTHRKLQQVQKEDPEFMTNLYEAFETAKECYSGPVLSSARNTNNAWMETKLSWFYLDDHKWDEIKGDNKFDYQLAAGDDAQDVVWYEITPDLIEHADSHGPLFCYLLSSFLVSKECKKPSVVAAVKNQVKELLGTPVKPAFSPLVLKV